MVMDISLLYVSIYYLEQQNRCQEQVSKFMSAAFSVETLEEIITLLNNNKYRVITIPMFYEHNNTALFEVLDSVIY